MGEPISALDVDWEKYPMRWLYEHRGGYFYPQRVPCRVLGRGPKRVKIAALKVDGTEVVRWVAPERLSAARGIEVSA